MIELPDGTRAITATEAPLHLGPDVSPGMVRQWRRRRLINGYPLGRETYYILRELVEVEFLTRTRSAGRPRGA